MILRIYAIYDSAAAVYMRPFYCTTDKEAQRAFADLAKDSTHSVGRHPNDYTLFKLGTYDDNTGMFLTSPPESMGNALEYTVEPPDSVNNADLFAQESN